MQATSRRPAALLGDEEPSVRATALGALARAGGLDASDLIAALADPAPLMRRRAIEIIASSGSDPLASGREPASAARWTRMLR